MRYNNNYNHQMEIMANLLLATILVTSLKLVAFKVTWPEAQYYVLLYVHMYLLIQRAMFLFPLCRVASNIKF